MSSTGIANRQVSSVMIMQASPEDREMETRESPGVVQGQGGRGSGSGGRGGFLHALLAPWAVAAAVSFTAPAHEAAAHTGAGAGAGDPVHIPDANLRAKVEAALNKDSGDTITHAEMAGLRTCIYAIEPNCLALLGPYSDRTNVAGRVYDLTGLEHATGLIRLRIRYHPISDLTPIAGLTSLTELNIEYGNVRDLTPIAGLTNLEILRLHDNHRISDLTPLASLTSLRWLTLSGNRISDLAPLASLTGLTRLLLFDNRISDLTPLAGLVNLDRLYLDRNRVTDVERLRGMTALTTLRLQENYGLRDISPLSALTSLTFLDLDATGVEDIQPLVDNSGLGSGDTVSLDDVPTLNDDAPGHFATLRGRGVTVWENLNQQWQVQNVRVTPGPGRLTVTWDPLQDVEYTKVSAKPQGYKVQWRSGAQDWSDTTTYRFAADYADLPGMDRHRVVSGVNTRSYTISGLTPGVAYTVRVKPDFGTFYAAYPSDEATGTPQAPRPPSRPKRVTATPGVESLIVSWNPVAGANGYKVQWKSGEESYDSTTREAHADDTGHTGHTIPELTPGIEYTVRVIATKANSLDGPPSAEATAIPLMAAPDRVTGVTVTPGVESLIVSWNPVAGASGYKVQWRSGEEGYDPTTRQAHADDIGHTIPELTPGIEYTVRVIAARANAPDGQPSGEVVGVPGHRVGVSIADAVAVEGAAVEFPVRLTEPSIAVVRLTWTTEGGTARPGEDYRAVATGSLTLQPGDRAGTLRVRTLDDRKVEPAETFRARLTDATNADVEPGAASATGTITDDDTEPARSRALSMVLAGVGRRIAADTVDVVEERLTGRPAGAQAALGGLTLTRRPSPVASGAQAAPGERTSDAAAPWGARHEGFGRGSSDGGAGGRSWTPGEGFRQASVTELLSRSRFDLPLSRQDAATGGAMGWRVWGRGSTGGFDSRPEAGFRMDGDVGSGYIGLDYHPKRDTLLGMAISHGRSDADYEIDAVTTGTLDLEMTSVLPYARWNPRSDLSVWGMLGAGWGDAELKDEAGRVETGLTMRMAAGGLRQEMATWRGIDLALKIDAFLIELEAKAAEGLPKTAGDANRLRLRLEGRMQRTISPVSQLTPSLEIGGRWDGGDAETGLGVEVGGGLAYSHTTLGLAVEARGRLLVAHREETLDEWGGSLTVKLDPGQARVGPWATFAPGWGVEASRVDRIWDGAEVLRSDRSADETRGLSPDRLDLVVGYGLATRGGTRLLTPYAELSMARSRARSYTLGTRLEAGNRMDLSVEGRRSVRTGRAGEYGVMLYGGLQW